MARAWVTLATLTLLIAACGPRPTTAPTPDRGAGVIEAPEAPPALPPVPLVEGPLRIAVVYPPANYAIPSPDSNFIFGSVGNGRATLTINGVPVRVHPNGAFLAWLANPPKDAPRYDLVAVTGRDTARLTHPIRYPAAVVPLATTGALTVDSASLTPGAATSILLRPNERVRVSVRAPANASAWVVLPGGVSPLTPEGETFAADFRAAQLRDSARVMIVRGTDTLRLPLGRVELVQDSTPQWVRLKSRLTIPDTDQVVNGRPVPGDTYRWALMPGTVLPLTARQGGYARVRLDSLLEIWVNADETEPVAAGTPAPRRVAGNARVRSGAGWTDLVIPMSDRPAFLVEEGDRSIVLTLYGTRGNTDIISYPTGDSLVRRVEWTQELDDRARYTIHLAADPFGYLALWENNAFVLRVRRPPVPDRRHPLRGRTIAVDPGHPPIGATGPTGLYEAQATLWVGERLRQILEDRGARVVMTRTTMDPVELAIRPVIARRGNAEAFVSIHFDALPDGENPFTRVTGSSDFFYRGHSEALARAVKLGVNRRIAIPDNGIAFRSLAVVRPSWVPAILVEGAFLMIPEQEAAVRDPTFQEQLARGLADGLEAYFRGLLREQ